MSRDHLANGWEMNETTFTAFMVSVLTVCSTALGAALPVLKAGSAIWYGALAMLAAQVASNAYLLTRFMKAHRRRVETVDVNANDSER